VGSQQSLGRTNDASDRRLFLNQIREFLAVSDDQTVLSFDERRLESLDPLAIDDESTALVDRL